MCETLFSHQVWGSAEPGPAVTVGDVHLQCVLPKFHLLVRGTSPISLGICSACANLFLGKEVSHADLAEESKLFNLKW